MGSLSKLSTLGTGACLSGSLGQGDMSVWVPPAFGFFPEVEDSLVPSCPPVGSAPHPVSCMSSSLLWSGNLELFTHPSVVWS